MKTIIYLITLTVIVGIFSLLIFPKDAHAYLDPGTGSYILQMLIAAIVGGLFMIKPFFKKIKMAVKKIFKSHEQPEE